VKPLFLVKFHSACGTYYVLTHICKRAAAGEKVLQYSKTLFGGIVFENSRCAGILFDCLHTIYACKIYMGLSLFTVNLQ
jgi:hypothetical protein